MLTKTIDVIIPTYKPDEKLLTIVQKLRQQSITPGRIVLINTEQKYLANLLRGRKYDNYGKLFEVRNISLREFDHGGTRNEGAKGSTADYLLFMTMDACPADEKLIENMLAKFEDERVAAVYARQLPNEDASLSERFSRSFNYPEESCVKSAADKERLGIKTYFCSNACAMYRRDVFEALGRFPKDMIFNEDMVFAHKLIENGWCIAYAADAAVYHSHNYTNSQQFHRNFDLAVSQAMHPEVFEDVSSESEGKTYVKEAFRFFKKEKRALTIIPFGITCAYRLVGYKLGRNYKKLTKRQILRCTNSKIYFYKHWS
ncbi:MAG: glycosyltransferase family 2 protein [Lachnospiraceae bacterium]|nr:glycosyltransferase family 2 protein [Lachnospiraceae bacterium]